MDNQGSTSTAAGTVLKVSIHFVQLCLVWLDEYFKQVFGSENSIWKHCGQLWENHTLFCTDYLGQNYAKPLCSLPTVSPISTIH